MIRQLLILAQCYVLAQAMGFEFGGKGSDCGAEVKCPKGYKLFTKRANGPWCLKVIKGNMTWWEAERECRCTTRGAHLSGIESQTEKQWVEQQTQNILDDVDVKSGAIWIGAYRRKECPSGATSTNPLCSAEKLLQFTDQHTCKTAIFQNWVNQQPTNRAGDDCGVIVVSTEESGENADASGKTAVKNCLEVNGPTRILSSVGFVCGVKPVQGSYGDGYSGSDGYSNGGYGGGAIIIGAPKPKNH